MFLVLLIGYGGAGVNLVSYCCEHCEDIGTEVLASEDCCCCKTHLADTELPCKSEGHCGIQRVQFDWNTFIHDSFSFQPMVCPIMEFILSLFNIDSSLPSGAEMLPVQNSPPMLPRIYLSFLTLLLI